MKKLYFLFISMGAMALTANAQFEMGSQVSYLTGHGKYDNHATLVGAMIYGRYTIANNMAVGAAIHAYNPKTTKYKSGNLIYSATDAVTNVSTTYDILLGNISPTIQPYAGLDMGISTSTHNITYVDPMMQTQKFFIKQKYAMFSPKVGFNKTISKSVGMFTQFQYNFAPGNGDPTTIYLVNGKSTIPLTTEPISKYFNIDTGIYYQIGNIRKYYKK